MDLTQLANLGEFIGGVAVLVTFAVSRDRNPTQQARGARLGLLLDISGNVNDT
jgi:hypothetical protein